MQAAFRWEYLTILFMMKEKMAKKSKTVKEVSHEEVNDALARFLKKRWCD